MILSRDVQSEKAPVPIDIDWVTISNICIPFGEITLNGLKFAAIPQIKASVNLPSNQRGIHASRSYEAVKLAVAQLERSSFYRLAPLIAENLLEKHLYSTKALVTVRAKFFNAEKTPISMVDSLENFEAVLLTYARRLNNLVNLRNFVGVKAAGITACPCAKEAIREIYESVNGGLGDKTPIATHMQRSYASILVENDGMITFQDLLEVLKQSFSSNTLELLKRPDEAALVLKAVESPRFVEDVVRYIAEALVKRFPNIPDENRIRIKVKSLESIHQHNIESSLYTTFGRIRKIC